VIIIIPLDSPIFDDLTRQDGEEEMVDNFVNQLNQQTAGTTLPSDGNSTVMITSVKIPENTTFK